LKQKNSINDFIKNLVKVDALLIIGRLEAKLDDLGLFAESLTQAV